MLRLCRRECNAACVQAVRGRARGRSAIPPFRNAATHKRAGCEFLNMRERDRALIQRYINKLERERNERTGAR